MEQNVLSMFESSLTQNPLSLKPFSLALSLIKNPSTSHLTLSSLLKTLSQNLLSLHHHHHHTFSLLTLLSLHHPNLSPQILTTIRPFCHIPSSLSLLLSMYQQNQTMIVDLLNEAHFLSLCFGPSLSIRNWVLKNVSKFTVKPSVLVMTLLGFSKDPYPRVRKDALDGLVWLAKCVMVEDESLIQGCYFRAVEVLFDVEDCVRCSAVRAVSEWGQLLVASSEDERKKYWSDALFVQLCSMVRDMSVEVRVEAFDAVGKIQMMSENILLQTISKRVLEINKEKKYPGQFTAEQYEIPASSAAGAFVHGLEDEFFEVRRSACFALRTLAILSSEFSGKILNLLMDVLHDDDSMVVRLQCLETLHQMAIFDCLEIGKAHMHTFLGTLVDTSTLIRSSARIILRLTKLHDLDMLKLCFRGLMENLEMYPQDEPDVFSVLFNIGRSHGKFASSFIEEVSQEMEPSFEGNLRLDSARTASLLVLAISTPLSGEQRICSIPSRIFSYAVTLLGRISHGLADVMNQNTLLAYLTHCSRSTLLSASEFFQGEEHVLHVVNGDPPNDIGSSTSHLVGSHGEVFPLKLCGLRKVLTPPVDYQLEVHNDVTNCVKLILAKMTDIWALFQFECTNEALRTLRTWKEELATFTTDSLRSADVLSFVLQYLRVAKLLGKAWMHLVSSRKFQLNAVGELGLILGKLDRRLRETRYRFVGLNKEAELHILELILVACTMRLSYIGACCHESTWKKLHSTISRVEFLHEEGSIEPSKFVIELRNLLREIAASDDGDSYSPFMFQETLEFFSLKQFVFKGELKHVFAELDAQGNDFENPLPFIPGLPVGIPLEITLYNALSEARLWLRMTGDNELSQFVFLDLSQFEGSDQIRKFKFVAPFYKTPKASSFRLRVCIGMECLSEKIPLLKYCRGPKHELAYLCKEKEVYLSKAVK